MLPDFTHWAFKCIIIFNTFAQENKTLNKLQTDIVFSNGPCFFSGAPTCWMTALRMIKLKRNDGEMVLKRDHFLPTLPPFGPMHVFTWETREQRKPLKREASRRGGRHWWGERRGDSWEREGERGGGRETSWFIWFSSQRRVTHSSQSDSHRALILSGCSGTLTAGGFLWRLPQTNPHLWSVQEARTYISSDSTPTSCGIWKLVSLWGLFQLPPVKFSVSILVVAPTSSKFVCDLSLGVELKVYLLG